MSAFSLGSIRAVLGIDTGGYTKGLLDAQVANEVFGHTVTNFINNPLLGSIQILKNVAGATVAAVRETAFLNQEYLRTAERVGISTRTISGLQMAYRDMGLSAQELEKHFVIMSKLIDDAATGNETAIKTFARLGVSVTDVTGRVKSNDEIFREASDGLARLGSQQAKVSIANDLFGRGAEKVLDIVGRGGDVIEDFIEKASRYGQVVGDEDARASNELASALGDLNFAIDGAKKSLSTRFISSFLDEFAGSQAAVDGLADSLRKLEPAAQRAGAAIGTWLADSLEGLGILAEKLDDTQDEIDKVSQKWNTLSSSTRVEASRPTMLGIGFTDATWDQWIREQGGTLEGARRAARPHDLTEINDELRALHARQEHMRALRARR